MTLYTSRTNEEQNLITKAICFEIEAIKEESSAPNPYRDTILSMKDGEAVQEAINVYLEEWGNQ